MTDEDDLRDSASNNQDLVAALRSFPTFEELRQSQVYRDHKPDIARLLDTPRVYRSTSARPRLRSFLRVVEWNIERGTRLDGIVQVLNHHPVLRFADLLLINELDEGMVRSGNVNVGLELGRALSAHVIFGVEYLELTKGAGDERKLPGQNTTALHGNAILTRHSFSDPEIVRLPRCENNFEAAERRIGGRIGILLNLDSTGNRLTVGSTHLDVVNTPRCRGKQMRAFLRSMDARIESSSDIGASIVGGDLNTHTFARGTRLQAMKNTATILASNRTKLGGRLIRPQAREPAVREFARFGFEISGFNDRRATSRSIVSNLDDPTRLPRIMKWWVNRRVGPEGLLLEFRLDWLAARGLRALKTGELIDEEAGVASVDAQTFQGLTHKGTQLSDHDPIVVDIALEAPQS